ncbi:chromate efflux transporter [Actinoplanes solisilvae]|uniref:chromate efflux transporter n=1 Tax=Actinoplanes solisilvae TaxID=2486853 RepID=UPI000FD9EC8E|nr:chromate efflux transporter [Actinoplanes solisilvae]
MTALDRPARRRATAEVFWVFLRIGALSFGGPAATTGLVHSKVVLGLKWIDQRDFLDLAGMVSVLPGPNAVEMAMHIGRHRAGRAGFLAGGVAFLLPGAVLATVLGALYVRYGTTPAAASLLYGVKPVVVAVTAWTVIRLAKSARPRRFHRAALMAAVAIAYVVGVDELLLLGVAGLAGLAAHLRRTARSNKPGAAALVLAVPIGQPDLWSLAGVFLKAGALLFGGGAVLLALLRGELVVDRGWITETQLLDAIAVGQVTPGPVLNTATFLGYTLGGLPGALIVTIVVVLPSFLLMAAAGPLLRLIRAHDWARATLDGITLGAIGVLAGVTVEFGRTGIVDPLTGAVAVGAALILWLRPQSALVLVAAGAAFGLLRLGAQHYL